MFGLFGQKKEENNSSNNESNSFDWNSYYSQRDELNAFIGADETSYEAVGKILEEIQNMEEKGKKRGWFS